MLCPLATTIYSQKSVLVSPRGHKWSAKMLHQMRSVLRWLHEDFYATVGILTIVVIAVAILRQHPALQCHQECFDVYMSLPVKYRDPSLLSLIKEMYLEPPPEVVSQGPVDIYAPIWRKLMDWYLVQEVLKDLFKEQPAGLFIEVGACDGEFMSQTLYLERNLSWSGLLVEPDPRSYTRLRALARNVTTAPVCVDDDYPTVKRLWQRNIPADIPEQYHGLMMARSQLYTLVDQKDLPLGSSVWVPCVPLTSLLLAANMTSVDFLALTTGDREVDQRINDVITSQTFDVKLLLVQFQSSRLTGEPFPEIPGYIPDLGRSLMLERFYWSRKNCREVEGPICSKLKSWHLVEACYRYSCQGKFDVWTYA